MPDIRGSVIHNRTRRPLPHAWIDASEPEAVSVKGAVGESDAAGNFRLSGVSPGIYRITAQFDVEARSGYRFSFAGSLGPITVEKDDIDVIVEVDVRGAIVGNVIDVDRGTPLRGAALRILEDTGGQIGEATQENGWYSFGYINPGCYTLTCECAGYERSVQKVFVRDAAEYGVTELPIFLSPLPTSLLPDTGVLRGFVLNEVDNPAVGAEVTLLGEGIKRVQVVTKNYFDYQLGHYEFRDVPEGAYRVVAIKSGMEPIETQVTLSRGKDNWAPDLKLKSIPFVTPPEIERLSIEPPSIIQGQAIKIAVRLKEPIHRVAYLTGNLVGPGGWNMGFSIDTTELDGTLTRTFSKWEIPGLFVLTRLMVQNRETGKGFELPVNARFEVVPRSPAPLSLNSPIFNVPR